MLARLWAGVAVQWEQYLREDLQTRPYGYEIGSEHGYWVLFVRSSLTILTCLWVIEKDPLS